MRPYEQDEILPFGGHAVHVVPIVALSGGSCFGVVIAGGGGEIRVYSINVDLLPTLCRSGVVNGF